MIPPRSAMTMSVCWMSDSAGECRSRWARWRECREGLSDAATLAFSVLMLRRNILYYY